MRTAAPDRLPISSSAYIVVPNPSPPQLLDIHIGRRITARRRLLKMSQKELAQRLGYGALRIRRHERGLTPISAGVLKQFGQALRDDEADQCVERAHASSRVRNAAVKPGPSDGMGFPKASVIDLMELKNGSVERYILYIAKSLP